MKKCFVIQPFSAVYNGRFETIYKLAITAAGLDAFRVGGAGSEIITEEIEKGIRNAHICFADITENNPNVWYELGFAYACNKRVVMVCNEEERKKRNTEKFPFDVRVKNVIIYASAVDSDKHSCMGFQREITDDAKAKAAKADGDSPAAETVAPQKSVNNNLKALDKKVLIKVVEIDARQRSDILYSGVGVSELRESLNGHFLQVVFNSWIKDEPEKYAESDINFSLGLLQSKGFVEQHTGIAVTYKPTDEALRWYDEHIRN